MKNRLGELRRGFGIKQVDFSARLKCSRGCLSCYERGELDTPTDILFDAAQIFGTSVDYMLYLTDEKKPHNRSSRQMKNLCKRLRDLREDSDITQKKVAEYLGCSQVSYSYYEIGRRDMPPEVLVKLAAYYNTSVDYLLGLTDEKNPYPRASK